MTRAAFSGSYSDFKIIRTRKCVQVVIELPLEQGGAFVAAFGMPNPGAEVPVAIARLTEQPKTKPANKDRQWDEISPAEQAGMRCHEWQFRRFLCSKSLPVFDETSAAQVIRTLCGVKSRRDLNTDERAAQKWHEIDAEYQQWQARAA